MLRLPPLPELPDHLRGQSFSVVEAAFLGDEAEGAKLLRPLRELGPAMDTFATITPDRLLELQMDPPEPVPGMSDHLMLADAPPEAIDALVEAEGPGSTPRCSRSSFGTSTARLGDPPGTAARPGRRPARVPRRAVPLFAVGIRMDAEAGEAIERHAGALRERLAPWAADRAYLNFAERPTDAETAFPPEQYRRLREVRGRYDPNDLFCANHPIPAR